MAFFRRKSSRLNKDAELLLSAAKKVENYRGDLFSDEEKACLHTDVEALRAASTPEALTEASEKLKETLKRLGGSVFPQKMIPEWVELIIVAAILAGGIRAFFFQLFKIPTNSMFPTYNGMTSELCSEEVNPAEKWFERIFRSASFYEVKAPVSGEVSICVNRVARTGSEDVFEAYVGNVPVSIRCPRDFSMDSVFLDRFFPEHASDKSLSQSERWMNAISECGKLGKAFKNARGETCLKTGVRVKAGETFLNFKILGGDMVVVNRFVYHFKKPEIGEPFVFRTHNIPGLNNAELYYIKRLAGVPGDTLLVEENKLYRNGNIIEGAEAFDKNNNRVTDEAYYGYLPRSGGKGVHAKPLNKPFTVPADFYYALGDNSGNSFDSRGWGCVPADDAVGRASFILYPFSRRWGIAK